MEIDTTVDVELDDFDIEDVIEYLEDNGYTVISDDKDPDLIPNYNPSVCYKSSRESIKHIVATINKFKGSTGYMRDLISSIVYCNYNTDVDKMLSMLKEMID